MIERDTQNTAKTSGIIIIGNEILSGKVRDDNSFYIVTELRKLGVDVRRISVIPDEIETIGREALDFSNRYDYVFTTGGVGPTHDDVTMAGIASGFKVNTVRHPEIEKGLLARYGESVNNTVLKMAEVPDGAEVIMQDKMRFPLILFGNIFIFPGIPEYLQNKFSLIKERFRCPVFYLKRFFLNANESDIAEMLNMTVAENPEVTFGSYPALGKQGYRIIITAESKSKISLNKAVDDLIKRLPGVIIVKTE